MAAEDNPSDMHCVADRLTNSNFRMIAAGGNRHIEGQEFQLSMTVHHEECKLQVCVEQTDLSQNTSWSG